MKNEPIRKVEGVLNSGKRLERKKRNSKKRYLEKQVRYWCAEAYYAGHEAKSKAKTKKCGIWGNVGQLTKVCKNKTTKPGYVDQKPKS